MNIETAKQINLADYLHSLGYSPVKQQGINLWYKSPLREETEASFKVNTERNQWYDFGLGKGGGIIELAAHLYATDHIPYLLERIAEQTPHVHPVSFSFGKQDSFGPSFQQLEIVPLSSPALLAYLQGRGINLELAKRECREARYIHNGKRYFAIAFPNGSGGFEVRNPYFKGCIAPKEISHIRQAGKARTACYVFEGFMDYLSFLTLRLPELSGIGRAGLHCIELRIEYKQGSLSVGQLRAHPLLFRQRPCRHGSTPANPHGIRQRPVYPGRFADLWRVQGLERILTKTG